MGEFAIKILIGLLIVLLAPSASASFIAMQINTEVQDSASIINVTNVGDEPAHQVQLVSKVLDKEYEGKIQDKVSVRGGFSERFPINFSDKSPGNYPLLTTVHYQDANGHMFSALSATLSKNKEPARSDIVAELKHTEIVDKVRVPVTIKNLGETSKELKVLMFISDEFIVKDNRRTIAVAPKSEEKLVFEIENFAARPKSTYVFFVISEYDEDEVHRSSINIGNLKVIEKTRFINTKIIIAIVAALVLIVIILQLRKRK